MDELSKVLDAQQQAQDLQRERGAKSGKGAAEPVTEGSWITVSVSSAYHFFRASGSLCLLPSMKLIFGNLIELILLK